MTNSKHSLLDFLQMNKFVYFELDVIFLQLPRPPVYLCATVHGLGEEQYCCVRLWILIQAYIRLLSDANVLLICIEHFCWKFLEINGECEVRDSFYYWRKTNNINFSSNITANGSNNN